MGQRSPIVPRPKQVPISGHEKTLHNLMPFSLSHLIYHHFPKSWEHNQICVCVSVYVNLNMPGLCSHYFCSLAYGCFLGDTLLNTLSLTQILSCAPKASPLSICLSRLVKSLKTQMQGQEYPLWSYTDTGGLCLDRRLWHLSCPVYLDEQFLLQEMQ